MHDYKRVSVRARVRALGLGVMFGMGKSNLYIHTRSAPCAPS